MRNTPLLVQMFVVYFGFAGLGWKVPVMVAAVAALVINLGAYTCEIVRAGMDAIHKGQIEAAECLALTRAQVYWHVVLVPALEKVYPALTSQFVLLMLASSITSQIGRGGTDGGREPGAIRNVPVVRGLPGGSGAVRDPVVCRPCRVLGRGPHGFQAPAQARHAALGAL